MRTSSLWTPRTCGAWLALLCLIGCRAPDMNQRAAAAGNQGALTLQADGLYVGNRRTFLLGANYGGIQYGQNFGATAWYPEGNGFSRNLATLEKDLDAMISRGIRIVRIGLVDDGRALLDAEGRLSGYNDLFRRDVSAFLDALQARNMAVIFTLLDYMICSPGRDVSGVYIYGRRNLIENPDNRQMFVETFWKPFLAEFGAHPAFFGIDLLNEPFWLVAGQEGGRWEYVEQPEAKPDTPVALADLQAFLKACLAAIREGPASGKPVTVGDPRGLLHRLDPLDLDYSAVHWYADPDELDNVARIQPAGRPWVLQEFPLVSGDTGAAGVAYLRAARRNGAAGAFFWNWTPNPDDPRTPHSAEARDKALKRLR